MPSNLEEVGGWISRLFSWNWAMDFHTFSTKVFVRIQISRKKSSHTPKIQTFFDENVSSVGISRKKNCEIASGIPDILCTKHSHLISGKDTTYFRIWNIPLHYRGGRGQSSTWRKTACSRASMDVKGLLCTIANNLCKLFFFFFALLFTQDTLLPLPPYKTCAVVGSSGILSESRCGTQIDKMAFVFRFDVLFCLFVCLFVCFFFFNLILLTCMTNYLFALNRSKCC